MQEKEHHFYYEVFRAADVDELIPASVKSASTPVLQSAAPAGTHVKALEVALAEKETKNKALEAALADKEAEKEAAVEAALAEKEAENAALKASLKAALARKQRSSGFLSCLFRRRADAGARDSGVDNREMV